MTGPVAEPGTVRLLTAAEAGERVAELSAVLIDCVEGGASVSFMAPLTENQPHRADVAKMLVRRSARRRGLGAGLLRAAEEAALAAGRTLLVLDTVTGSEAERLYQRMGWIRVGVVPDYALWPDGRPCDATFFYRRLSRGIPAP
jgi:GNAT superfamily N-acetyltransferase